MNENKTFRWKFLIVIRQQAFIFFLIYAGVGISCLWNLKFISYWFSTIIAITVYVGLMYLYLWYFLYFFQQAKDKKLFSQKKKNEYLTAIRQQEGSEITNSRTRSARMRRTQLMNGYLGFFVFKVMVIFVIGLITVYSRGALSPLAYCGVIACGFLSWPFLIVYQFHFRNRKKVFLKSTRRITK